MDGNFPLVWRDESLQLLADRALYWPRCSTLVIADPHFGKSATFRSAGIPLPPGTTSSDLGRLTKLIDDRRPERLLILGDFWHAREGRAAPTLDAFTEWREARRELTITLVRGNHDRRAGDPSPAWDMLCVNEPLAEPPFAWRHYPEPVAGAYVLAGHLHPILRIRTANDRLQAPCFHFGEHVAVLPAFSRFTGGAAIRPRPGERVFAIGPGCVAEVPQFASR